MPKTLQTIFCMICLFRILPNICIKVRLSMLVSKGQFIQVSTRSSVGDMGRQRSDQGQSGIGIYFTIVKTIYFITILTNSNFSIHYCPDLLDLNDISQSKRLPWITALLWIGSLLSCQTLITWNRHLEITLTIYKLSILSKYSFLTIRVNM